MAATYECVRMSSGSQTEMAPVEKPAASRPCERVPCAPQARSWTRFAISTRPTTGISALGFATSSERISREAEASNESPKLPALVAVASRVAECGTGLHAMLALRCTCFSFAIWLLSLVHESQAIDRVRRSKGD